MGRARQRVAERRGRRSLDNVVYLAIALTTTAFFLGRGCSSSTSVQGAGSAQPVPAATVTVTEPTLVTVAPPAAAATGNPPPSVAPGAARAGTGLLPADGGPLDPRFRNCAAATSAGYGTYVAGVDPEYDWYPDTNGDLIVCD